MKTIPQVRQELLQLVKEVNLDRHTSSKIKSLVKAMYRRPYARKACAESRTMTPALAKMIRFDARRHPDYSYKKLANRHKVSIGRVSEAIAGKRTAA